LGDWKQPDEVKVLFMLGNPDDEHLMTVTGGYYGMGGAPGWLYLIGWPSDDVIGRIAYCAVHELHHQIRYQNVPWVPMVGEHVVSEGLAEAFVRELAGPSAMGPWSTMVSGSPLDAAYDKTVAAFELTGYDKTAAYVLGDTTARRFGSEPVGIPDMAGYAVGLRIVDAHLKASGLTVAQSTGLTGPEILSSANS
ncbi:MAG: peptidase, partial [Hamadaea sp.]|nr:peptidase [Hamadaea sp.]